MASYFRCSHCRGFYESTLERCKYCGQAAPLNVKGVPQIYPDRETCRMIQIAEYERLPAEAMADPMRPPRDELSEICACLHCGPDGPLFEAVEMRWLAEEKMWACPNTTCGGCGYSFDIHPVTNKWTCAVCQHKWKPPGGNAKPSNCKCPICGSVNASGWFDDEYSEEEIEAMSDEQYKAAFGMTRQEEEAKYQKLSQEFSGAEDASDEIANYDPEDRLGEDESDEEGGEDGGATGG